MIQPKQVLEIGTFTGYSALCFAEGLAPGGEIHTIDIDENLKEFVARYLREAGLSDRIHQYIGAALDLLPSLKHYTFDLVYLDADKENYCAYYDAVFFSSTTRWLHFSR
jgi:caffeoyl-CoA O-methyltransferase